MANEDEIPAISNEPPLDTDLYDILGVSEDATPDQIKTAYRKLALKHHPDKAPAKLKDEANRTFQQIAFAYAILSDERRRRRFDLTGSTAEAVEADDDFDWMDFYREQFSSAIDTNALDKLKQEYQGSEDEVKDILAAYENFRGDMDKIYDSVMLSNVIDDDARFRAIIDTAIAEDRIKEYKKYVEEPEKKRQLRLKRAQREAEEAEELGKEIEEKKAAGKGKGNKGGNGKKKGAGDLNDLAALIQQRQTSRAASFFDRLEEKYNVDAGQDKATGKGKKRAAKFEEPPEEAFQATAARQASSKKKKSKASD
ncbi:DnaJ-domain-containing protein [Aspergillus heteromorphus CBS 117.55]|uniref:DnaJ-domain-containing protein n=1 Tax=Aspergillus heteromorphus CBS 117.55 TaxID=1448321 RepID=A0A317VKL0_9EURO|nr:DnaJ-domain-containing protein [Aspergillus heteromorphus CBS 117.55]PWY74435.1 DnaJ-domain-containing protein [Aspergillus heteromorphus CBS 117.55]